MINIEVRQCVIAFVLLVVCMVSPNILLAQGMSGSKEEFSAKQYDKDNLKSDTLSTLEVYGKRPIATRQSLNGKELQSLSSTSVADALKYFAGVQIKDYGGLGGLKTINVRSLGAQHVGIYIDGIRITN